MAVRKFKTMVNPEKIKGDTRYGDLYIPQVSDGSQKIQDHGKP